MALPKNKILKVTIILFLSVLGIIFLPFLIGGFLLWLIYKKTNNITTKYILLTIIGIPTLLIGSYWTTGLFNSFSTNKQNQQSVVIPKTTSTPTQTQTPTPSGQVKKELHKVVKVIDGDTINVDINGKTETIRLIGIDSPETVDPRKPIQCFGKEASDKAKDVLMGKSVLLETDSTQGERDKYNRLLRYVFLEDGTNFNKLMIAEGYAHEYTYQSNPYKYQEEFKKAEKEARENKKGLWADGACVSPTPTIVQTQTQPTQPTNNSGGYTCNCSKTCTQISSCEEAYFQLNQCGCSARDGDKDGIPCESLCR